ncbi:MAG TPA: signal peptidase I [Gaiellaceae bacterium]|nr:signal peptidase I [Gaiellaceae bacterium]
MRSSAHSVPPAVRRPHPAVPERLRLPLALTKLAALGCLAAAGLWFGLPQNLGGRAEWVLVSGTSMLPRYHTGDLVLVEHQSSYHVGEVVAYRVPKGQIGAGHVVIHRIVGGNGRTGWKMKGDNRTAPDLWYPTNRDVLGARLLRIPDAWLVLRVLHMPLLLALFAGFGVFLWIGFGGSGECDTGDEGDA